MEKQIYLYTYIAIFILSSSCFTCCISSPPSLDNLDSRTENGQNQLGVNKTKEFHEEERAKPELSVHVSLKNLSRSKGATFEVDISVTNPLDHPIPVFELSYTLKSDSRVIASGTLSDPGSLKAKNITGVVFLADVPYDVLISLVKDILRDWDIDYEIDIGLTVHLPVIGKVTIPFSKKGEIKLPIP